MTESAPIGNESTTIASTSSSTPPTLPVIDISPLLNANASARDPLVSRAAEAIASACLKSRGEKALGFFYAVGHGVSEETLNDAHAAAEALWSSPDEVLSSLDARKSQLARGYLGLGALEHTCTRAELATLAQERLDEGGGGEKKEEEEAKKPTTTTAKTAGDFKQSFAFGCEREEEDSATHSPMHGPNQWPSPEAIESNPALSGFKEKAERFRAEGLDAARAIARGLSLALTSTTTTEGEKGDSGTLSMFESALSKPAALTVMLRYPPLPDGGGGGGREEKANGEKKENETAPASTSAPSFATGGGATSCGTHTDCGFLTIIDQRGLPGLEVFSNQREWIKVPPLRVARGGGGRGGGGAGATEAVKSDDGKQSALVVNLGDLAEYWSGGRVASTLHRVVVRGGGKKEGNARARDSLIVFSNANFDAPVAPPAPENSASEVTTTAGKYILGKLGIMWGDEIGKKSGDGGEEEKK